MINKDINCLFLEDMIANAFIEILGRKDNNVKELPLSLIENYGKEVGIKLESENNKVAYCFSRQEFERIKLEDKNYFTINEENSTVLLNDGVDVQLLIVRFRTYLPLVQLLAYMDKEVIQKVLLEPMEEYKKEVGFQKRLGCRL